MNERIEKLVVTAELSTDTEVPEFLDDFLEKFAELIVKECADVTNKHQGVVIQTDRGVVYEYNADLWIKIKEHFGVE